MTNFFAVRVPPGPGGDEFVGLLNKLDTRHRISRDIEKLTEFMQSDPDSTEFRSPQGILASEMAGGAQCLAGEHDEIFQMKSIGKDTFGTQGAPSLLQNHVVVGASAVNSNFPLLSQEPCALNAVDILLGTAPGWSSNIMWSSGDPALDSVVKEEEQEGEYRPLFTLNPPVLQETYTPFKGADAFVKEEVDEDGGHQDSGAMESLVEEEEFDDDFGGPGDHEEEFGEQLKEDTNQDALSDLSASLADGRPYQCKVCNSHFPAAFILEHWRSHPFCDLCQKRFLSRELFSEHKRLHNACDVCGKTFYRACELKIHIRCHTGEKPFQCEQCMKSFTTKGHLKTHTRLHTGEKPFGCEVCQLRFTHKQSLTVHFRMHTGEKHYECTECKKRFRQKGQLTAHLPFHTGEKPHECPECQKRFANSSAIAKHRRRVHGLQNTSG